MRGRQLPPTLSVLSIHIDVNKGPRMAIDWDIEEYDPWDEYHYTPGAREAATDDCKMHMLGEHQDRAWAEEDEPRFVAALLVAGAEPEDPDHDAHQAWQQRAAKVLITKHKRCWWFEWTVGNRVHPDPDYRHKARMCLRDVQLDELRKFYAWVCKQRKEPWTDNLVPAPKTGLLLPY